MDKYNIERREGLLRKIGVFLIAALMAASMAVQPGAGSFATEINDWEPGQGVVDPGLFEDAPDDENGEPAPGDMDGGLTDDEGGGAQGSAGIGLPDEADTGDDEVTGDGEEELTALEEIEALTIEPGDGYGFDGYIVKVIPEEVTEEMIEAAPGDPIADSLFVVETPEEALEFADPDQIEVIEPNYIMSAFEFPLMGPDDPDYSSQWNLKDTINAVNKNDVRAEGMWQRGFNGSGVRVAVVDSGINAAHQDFGPIALGYNFTGGQGKLLGNNVNDGKGHGTMVSSIIAAKANNGLNIAGLAYEAEIVPFKVLDNNGNGSMADVMAALNYIAANNNELKISVVNMSLGAPMESPSPSLQLSVDKLLNKGVILVAAVGNGFSPGGGAATDYTCLMYPAACDGVVGVASISQSGVRSNFSQRNESVDVSAPGEWIYGLYNNDNESSNYGHGTSYAAPLVAAAAAAIKQAVPVIDHTEFMRLIAETSTQLPRGTVGKNTNYGYGLLNAEMLAEECGIPYSVRYFYDGVLDAGLTTVLYAGKGNPVAPAPDVITNVRIGYKVAGYYLQGEPVASGGFPVGISYGDVIDVCYESRGLNYEDGGWYFYGFGEDGEAGGKLASGWVEDENGYRYYSPYDGRMALGMLDVPGLEGTGFGYETRRCYFDPASGYVVTRLVRVGSYDYYFDGIAGMVKAAEAGAYVELTIDKETGIESDIDDPPRTAVYRFDANGRSSVGWFTDPDGKKYYDKDGRARGAKKIGSYFYYFDPAKNGALRTTTGLINDNDIYYYCYSASGYLRTGKFSAKINSTVSGTYYASKTTAALVTGQVKDGGSYYWYDGPNGLKKNIEREVDSKFWFYGSDGKRKSGWVTFTANIPGADMGIRHAKGDKVYYHSKNGLLTGARKIGSHWYWLDPAPGKNGALWTKIGEITDDRDPGNIVKYYCYSSKGYLRVGGEQAQKDDGGNTVKLYYDKSGRLAQGPHKVGSYLYYYTDGVRLILDASDWITGLDGGWYYVTAPQGRLKTGKFTAPESEKAGAPEPNAQLYLNTATGALFKGRVKIGGYHYYYNGKDGLDTEPGWIYENGAKIPYEGGKKLHYVTGANGRLKTGELKEPGTGVSYYFSSSDAKLYTGQIKIGSYYYYYEGEEGRVLGDERQVPDKKKIDRTHYYRESDGRRISGWVTHGVQPQKGMVVTNAVPASGNHKPGDKVYYHSSNGLLKGKQKIGSYWYWLDPDTGALWTKTGTMDAPFIVNKNETTGVTSYYYCYSNKGYLKANGWLRDLTVRDDYGYERKCTYYFDKNALRVAGPYKIGSYRYFFDRHTGALVKSDGYYIDRTTGTLEKLDGKTPIWILDGGNRYCTKRTDGRLLTGLQTIGEKTFYFESTGALCVNKEKKISGKWYFFNELGERLKNVWLDLPDGRQVYYGSNGARYSGVKKVAVLDLTGNVYEDTDGKKYEYWYCFNTSTGAKRTGWIVLSKKTYFYDPEWPTAADVGTGKNGAVAAVVPGARAHGEWIANGKQVYLDPKTGEVFTGQKEVGGFFYYYNGKNGKLYGAEKKIGSYTYYYRAVGEEEGFSYESDGATLKTGFLGAPVSGPAGSRVTGWWKMPANLGGDLKYYSKETGKLGRMQTGRQNLPKHYISPFDPNNKAYFFLGSNGLIRRNLSGVYNGFSWITNENGEVISWVHIGDTLKGIDVSYWQGYNIDWNQVRKSGVRVAICRMGYNGAGGNAKIYPDSTFVRNIKEAKKAGVHVGAYIYVYSCRTSELVSHIDKFAAWMKQEGLGPNSLDLPVFLDIEDQENLRTTSGYADLTNSIRAGMKRLEKHGYNTGFYSNLSWANNRYDAKKLFDEGYSFWLAHWYGNNAELNAYTASWNGTYPSVWQYRSTGRVPGISGNVDMNYIYTGRVKWT